MTQIPMTVTTIAPSSPIEQRLPITLTKTFSLTQARIPLATTIPAIGATVIVAITPISGTTTATAFPVGDLVVIDQAVNGLLNQRATFVVVSVASDNITIRYQPVAGDAATGAVLAANSEITGQTRLPSIPVGATWARVQIQASDAFINAVNTPTNPLNGVAIDLQGGLPMAYLNYAVAGTLPTDLVLHTGAHLGWTGFVDIANAIDLGNARLFSCCPLSIAPRCVVSYR